MPPTSAVIWCTDIGLCRPPLCPATAQGATGDQLIPEKSQLGF